MMREPEFEQLLKETLHVKTEPREISENHSILNEIQMRVQEKDIVRKKWVRISAVIAASFIGFLIILNYFTQGTAITGSTPNVPFNLNHGWNEMPLTNKEIRLLKKSIDWKVSKTFVSAEDNYRLTGINHRIAYYRGHHQQKPQIWMSGVGDKILWLVWGNSKTLSKSDLSVVAINKKSGSVEKVLTEGSGVGNKVWTYHGLYTGMFGADASYPSGMVFSKPGLWCLNIFINKKLIGQIVVKVK